VIVIRDEGDLFDAPVEDVWGFVGSRAPHAAAHGHTEVRRESEVGNSGSYSWEQPFEGASTRFTMRWTSFHPLGIAYEVLEGPFVGSKFFLYYIPRGERTQVDLVGTFESPTIPEDRLEESVRRFFEVEFEQDQAGLAQWRRRPGAELSGSAAEPPHTASRPGRRSAMH
jgi:hypothetical protein